MNENILKLPENIAIIMDGNRRYAQKKGLKIKEGHEAGVRKLFELLSWAKNTQIKNLVVYAFSTENWNRGEEQVSDLIAVFYQVLNSEEIKKVDYRIKIFGDISRFPLAIQVSIRALEESTSKNKDQTLWIALSYGGKADIINAVNKITQKGNIDENEFEKYLLSAGIPDIDMLIRTGGAERLSNFLPWQTTYSELFFVEELWPEFSEENFNKLIKDYTERKRNFGK